MGVIEKELQPFLNNPNFVFKSCQREWLVVLEKIPAYTKTNEEREVYDPNYAEYIGSKFNVVAIINKFDPTKKTDSVESTYSCLVVYKVGEIVEPDQFDSDLTKVCRKGIHYFKTPEPAYYYELNTIQKGILKKWHDNGRIRYIANYKDVIRYGKYPFFWYEDDQLEEESHYENGERYGELDGEFQEWYDNGQLKLKCR